MSNKLISKVVEAHLSRRASSDEDAITSERFIDTVSLALAFSAYMESGVAEEALSQKGLMLVRRYLDSLLTGTERYLQPLGERADGAVLKPLLRRLSIGGTPEARVARHAEFFRELFPWLKNRQVLMRDIFAGRSHRAAMQIAVAVSADNAASMLNQLAAIPSCSGLTAPRKWIEAAASNMGAPLGGVESLLADAGTAKVLGEKLAAVESKLAVADANSSAAAELQQERLDLLDRIEAVADSSASSQVVMSAATSQVLTKQEHSYQTEIGRTLGMTPEQEDALMVRGKALIAAGAGSGKTRVLAGKVVYHVRELGLSPANIIATSFSRKSAAELKERIVAYGGESLLENREASKGFGTTHSVGGSLLRKFGGGRQGKILSDYETVTLVRMAMAQVKMHFVGPSPEDPPERGLFDDAKEQRQNVLQKIEKRRPLSFREALETAYASRGRLHNRFLSSFIESFFNPNDTWYKMNMRNTNNLVNPHGLSVKQQDILIDITQALGIVYSPDADPVLNAQKQSRRGSVSEKTAAKEERKYMSVPANQWFNLGLELTTENARGEKVDIPLGEFKTAISKFKGSCISPEQAAHQNGFNDPHAAVYGAYEWLKGPHGEPDFQGRGEHDDTLHDVIRMLVGNPDALGAVQSRFKCILVDEAQDLNRAQHIIFGLIAGHYDPDTLEPYGDGRMTADTYCFIGDDKQAIYEFRAAEPEIFIDNSDLQGGEFKTKLLKTNFRSGKNIVDAANRLIAHNTKQIPMVCDSNPDRNDEGGIRSVPSASTGDAASFVAEQVKDLVGEAQQNSYDDFGIAIRTNAEAYMYGLEMLKRGIPFRSKVSFFNDRNTKALIAWLSLANASEGDDEKINQVVLEAHKAPSFQLGAAFVSALEDRPKDGLNHLEYLQSGGWAHIYKGKARGLNEERVKPYLEALEEVFALKSKGPLEVLDHILGLVGVDGTTIIETLVENVKSNEDMLAELLAESASGEISEEDLRTAALAPIEPLRFILKEKETLAGGMEFISQLQRANEKLHKSADPEAADAKQPAVEINTMHGWKGLEVKHMFVPMMAGRFPRGGSEEELASERRLAYVALTRGQDSVTVLDIPNQNPMSPIRQSQFIYEACIPSASGASLQSTHTKQASFSTYDESMMDAYLASTGRSRPRGW